MKTKDITIISILTAMSVVIGIIESYFTFLGDIIPGLKLLTVLLLPPGNLIIVGLSPVTLATFFCIFSISLKKFVVDE